jgi:thioredoxin-like negative regulator of GroEL
MTETSLIEAGLNDAKQLMQAGKFVEAEDHLLTLLVNAPKQGDVLYMMAVCQRYQKKYPEALETLKKTAATGSRPQQSLPRNRPCLSRDESDRCSAKCL